jgi:hypothetical protein
MMELGMDGYHDQRLRELQLDSSLRRCDGHGRQHGLCRTRTGTFGDMQVDAIVTAGVEVTPHARRSVTVGGNMQRLEQAGGKSLERSIPSSSSIRPLKPEAQIQALLTATEGKTAA